MKNVVFLLLVFVLLFSSSCDNAYDESAVPERIQQHEFWSYQYHDTIEDVTINDFDGWIVLEDCGKISSDFTLPTNFADGRKITYVGEYAFSNEEALVNVIIPDGYTGAEYFSFMNCENLETVCFGKDFNYIGTAAFTGCKNLRECVVSEDNPYFYSVDGCVISKEDSVLHISNGKVPDGVKKIRDLVFAQKGDSLSYVHLPDTLEEIGSHAFAETAITEIYIPNSVEKIGEWIFSEIDGIVINCEAESKPDGWNPEWLGGCTNYTVNWGVSEPIQTED